MLHQRSFRAMNTDVGVWLWSHHPQASEAVAAIPAFFEEVEQELSRFRPASALCRLNAGAGGGPQTVSVILTEVVRLAIDKARDTGGLFDPTILPALQVAGYDAPFPEVAARAATTERAQPAAPRTAGPRWQDIGFSGSAIVLPAGTAIDLGGIAKGWAVDRAAERLRALGSVMVDAGGDIRCTGTVEGRRWPIAVADPMTAGRSLAILELADEAVATSSIGRRRWQQGGKWMHHLIDPRTQRPAATDLHTVTVLGPRALECEIHTKVVLLLGSEAGAAHLDSRRLSGLLVLQDGAVRVVGERMARSRQ